MDAVRENQTLVALALIEADASTDWYTSDDRRTCLHWAVYHSNIPLVEALVNKGANCTAKDSWNRTPIQPAAYHSKWSIVTKFAELRKSHGNDNYGSALLDAVRENQTAVALALIKADASTAWYTCDDGRTSLHWAVYHRNNDLVRALVENGADITAKDSHGRRPQLDPNLLKLSLGDAVKKNKTDVALGLIRADVDISYVEEKTEFTLLHFTVTQENIVLTEALIERGADTTAKDHSQRTPTSIWSANRLLEVRTQVMMHSNFPPVLLNLIFEYYDVEQNSLDFYPENKERRFQLVKCLTSTETHSFKSDLEKNSILSCTAPFMVGKLEDFLKDNPHIKNQFNLSLDSFIKEIAKDKDVDIKIFPFIQEYMDKRKPVVEKVISEFKALYKTFKKEDRILHITKGFLDEKDSFSNEQFLEAIKSHLSTKSTCDTAICWKIACDLNLSLEGKAAKLNEALALNVFSFWGNEENQRKARLTRLPFIHTALKEELKAPEGWVMVASPEPHANSTSMKKTG